MNRVKILSLILGLSTFILAFASLMLVMPAEIQAHPEFGFTPEPPPPPQPPLPPPSPPSPPGDDPDDNPSHHDTIPPYFILVKLANCSCATGQESVGITQAATGGMEVPVQRFTRNFWTRLS